MDVGLSMIQSQSAKRRAQSVKGRNSPVGASSACDKTRSRNLSYRNEDVAPIYHSKRSALCALRFAPLSLTLNGSLSKIAVHDTYTLIYSKVRIRE
jgi:hypothetical protein